MALQCFKCERNLADVTTGVTNQPSGGLAFATSGHYGSTAFDPMDGTMLEINICDACLTLNSERVLHRFPVYFNKRCETWKPEDGYWC